MKLLWGRSTFIRVIILLVASSFLFCSLISAQEVNKTDTIHVTTRVVNLNIVVTDKDGNPVKDLTKDDFTILDGDKPQKIGFFSAFDNQSYAPVQVVGPDIYTNNLHLAGAPPSVTILLFDTLNSRTTSQGIGLNSVRKFLRKIRPQDHIGIDVLSDDKQVLKIVYGFNRDASELVAAMQRYDEKHSHQSTAASTPEKNAADTELDRFLAGKDNRANYAVSDTGPGAMTAGYRSDKLAVANQLTIASLQAIAQQLSGVAGRKSIIWVTDHVIHWFMTDDDPDDFLQSQNAAAGVKYSTMSFSTTDKETQEEYDRMVHLMNSVGIAIYTVDSRGLETADLGFKNPGTLTTPSGFSAPEADYAMLELSNRTGGRAFFNGNDLENGIQQALDDSRFTYSLGYYPDHGQWKGDTKLIVPKKREEFLASIAASPVPATQLQFGVHIAAVPTKDGAEIDAIVHFDPRRLLINQENGEWSANFELVFFQLDDKNKTYDVTTQSSDVNLKPEQYQRYIQTGVNIPNRLNFKRGATVLCIVLHDKRTDAVGSVHIPLSQYVANLNMPTTPAH